MDANALAILLSRLYTREVQIFTRHFGTILANVILVREETPLKQQGESRETHCGCSVGEKILKKKIRRINRCVISDSSLHCQTWVSFHQTHRCTALSASHVVMPDRRKLRPVGGTVCNLADQSHLDVAISGYFTLDPNVGPAEQRTDIAIPPTMPLFVICGRKLPVNELQAVK